MFFTKLGRIGASVILVLSVFRISTALLLAYGAEDSVAAAKNILGTATTGEAIDQGFLGFGIAIALGVLTEISYNVRSDGASRS